VRPLDTLLARLEIDRVNLIKMDIEGAEREALKGAVATIKASKPRLVLDNYHLEDDAEVLPKVILGIRADYASGCGQCEFSTNHGHAEVLPHVTYYF
jgi:hypothetical protein